MCIVIFYVITKRTVSPNIKIINKDICYHKTLKHLSELI